MSAPAISVSGLVKDYGRTRAVDGISFDVGNGEIFAFLGPNGAGKTTTIEILECIRPLTSGRALVLGFDVTKPREVREIKKVVGVLPQDFAAFERLTVRENIDLFARMYDGGRNAANLLRLLGLDNYAKRKFEDLSGGLRQRVGVAAAMVGDPRLLFLDEPTSGLDPEARREVWNVVRELKSLGKTIFLTTHYMEEAQALADRIAIINHGKIAGIGPPEELIRAHGGARAVIVRSVPETAQKKIRREFPNVRILNGQEVVISAKSIREIEKSLHVIAKLGLDARVEIRNPTIEDVFLSLIGSRISEEGELA